MMRGRLNLAGSKKCEPGSKPAQSACAQIGLSRINAASRSEAGRSSEPGEKCGCIRPLPGCSFWTRGCSEECLAGVHAHNASNDAQNIRRNFQISVFFFL